MVSDDLTDLFIGDYLQPGSTFNLIPRLPGVPILPSLQSSTETLKATETKPWEEFISSYKPLAINKRLYNQTRKSLEEGKTIEELDADVRAAQERLLLPAEAPLLTETPRAKPPELEIPAWEGKVSIAGRKLIAMNLSTKKYLNAASPLRPRSAPQGTFELKQELQLRVSGNVSDRVLVNIDYDDTKENKRDISIVYHGAPGETVKEVSFGDITLNLPQTQFTSYSKQLFGIKGDFDFKRARLSLVGSQTKGQFQVKRFSGQYQFESKDILDTSYIRRTYYNIAFAATHLPLSQGSVVLYRDDRNAANNANAQTMTVEDFTVAASTFSGDFDTLVAGVDYIVDYQKGILRFLQILPTNAVVAIEYTNAQGARLSSLSGSGRPKIIKTENDLPIADTNESGYRRELKTVYSIGRSKISRDDGTGNFILKVLEKGSRKDVSGQLGINYPSQILMDFEEGTFQLTQAIGDPEIYLTSPVSKYLFSLEYRFTLKTYFLQPNIVVQSEKIYKDGALMTRDIDYFIDYDSGFLTFLRPETITPSSQIEVTYEVAPFGGGLAETLIASRGEFDILNNVEGLGFTLGKLSLGSSVLLQQAAKPASIPDIRSLPTSFSIFEGDIHLAGIKFPGPIPITSNIHSEVAQSVRDPNTFNKALIENMEGIKTEDSATLLPLFWQMASNPPNLGRTRSTSVSLAQESVKVLDINPNADATTSDTQQVLKIDYDLSLDTAASIAYVFSPIGLDFSGKESLDVTLQSDTTSLAPDISFQLGKISEDADGDGSLDTEDKNSDGSLNFGEDVGYSFNNADGSSVVIGGNNAKLDSEDLDKNGRLDPEDPTIGGSFGLVSGSTASATNFTNWITTSVSLGINSTNLNRWTSIKVLRITLRRKPGDKATGTIRIAKLGTSGIRWERPTVSNSSGTFEINPINNVDQPNYQPLFNAGGEVGDTFKDLYSSQQTLLTRTTKRKEQALRLTFTNFAANGAQTGQGLTRLPFTRAVDIGSHKVLSFFVHGPPTALLGNTSFFFQLGSASDFYEYQVPLANLANQWYLIRLNLEDLNRDGKIDTVSLSNHQDLGAVIVKRGNPNLASVSQFQVGVRVAQGEAPISGELWMNDVFLVEPRKKSGIAKYLSADFDIPGWMSFGGSYKNYNQDFEGLGQAIVNQGLTQRNGFLSFNKLSFMPFNTHVSKEETLTPSAIQTGPSNLVSQLSEGRVEKFHGDVNGNFQIPKVPVLNWSSSRDKTDNRDIGRQDNTYTYSTNYSWGNPFGLKALQNWNAGYDRRNFLLTFPNSFRKAGFDNLKEYSDTWNTGMSFGFFSNRLNFNPNYRTASVKEQRKNLAQDDMETITNYPKSQSQNSGFNGTLRLAPWLEPSFSFTSDVNENNRVEASSFTITGNNNVFQRGDIKSITRNANTSISQNVDFAKIVPKLRLFQAFSHFASYQTSDGDSYENVDKSLKTRDKLWVRQELKLPNAGSRRTNLTLRDTVSLNSRWSPFLALLPSSAWSSLAITHNYSRSLERSEVTGTQRKNLSLSFPDLTVSLNQLERLIFAQKWMSSSLLSTRYSERKNTTFGIDQRKDLSLGGDLHFLAWQNYDLTLNYTNTQSLAKNLQTQAITNDAAGHSGSAQIGFNARVWRFTNKIEASQNRAKDTLGRLTQDQKTIAPSVSVRGDFNLPGGLKLPFSSKALTFTNRVILTSGLKFERKSSSLAIEQTNTDQWDWNLNGDFEVGKNVRAGLGSGFSLFKNRVLKDQDFYTFNINGQVIFQF